MTTTPDTLQVQPMGHIRTRHTDTAVQTNLDADDTIALDHPAPPAACVPRHDPHDRDHARPGRHLRP